MRRVLPSVAATCVAATFLLSACSGQPSEDPTTTPPPAPAGPPSVPPAPEPATDGPCPYLDKAFVEDTNGQKVSKTKTSTDQPPTCFFYALNGKTQLTVRVFNGDAAVAEALVDQAAPIDTSNPAEEPAGWKGGYQQTDGGSVYAVAKGGHAVVVTSNQEQSIKGRTITTEAIAGLRI